MSSINEQVCSLPKKIKLGVAPRDDLPIADFFADFSVVKILSENAKQKSLFVHGRFGDSPKDAVLLLERTPFNPSSISDLLQTDATVKVGLQNDVYKTLELYPNAAYSGNVSLLMWIMATFSGVFRISEGRGGIPSHLSLPILSPPFLPPPLRSRTT